MTGRSATHGLLIRDAEVEGRLVDIAVEDGLITSVSDAVARAPRSPVDGLDESDEFDAGGGSVIPGLHDHHIHLLALAAARQSIAFSPSIEKDLAAAHSDKPIHEWLRVTGYHESIVGEIDCAWLDERMPDRPVRVQHRTGAMWVLNSAAMRVSGIESIDGMLFGADDLIRERVPRTTVDLSAVGRELAAYGITGVTDLTPTEDAEELGFLSASVLREDFPIGVMVTGGPGLEPDAAPGLARGPVKIVVGDHDLPHLEDLAAAFRTARRLSRNVAVHCVTRIGLILALAAWEEVGPLPGDRIEHGAVIPLELIGTIGEFGLTVVTQPSFTYERGDQYLADVDSDDVQHLWRCGSLIDAGIAVGGSTDAPFGDPDPWRAIVAATERRTSSGSRIGRDERIDPGRALGMFMTSPHAPGGRRRRVAVGEPGELCILHLPLDEALRDPSSAAVRATYARRHLHLSE